MEVGAAHFSRVEFSTELPFPFAKDIASLARTAVKRQKERLLQPINGTNQSNRPPSGVSSAMGTIVEPGEQVCYTTDSAFKDVSGRLFALPGFYVLELRATELIQCNYRAIRPTFLTLNLSIGALFCRLLASTMV